MRFVDRINAVGTALANEQVVISAPVTERVVSLNFADGGYVRQGQVIATMAHSEEQAQLAAATAQQREAGQQLERIRTLKERGFATNASLDRSEEHTSELQSLMRISYAVFCLKKKINKKNNSIYVTYTRLHTQND